MSAVLLLVGGAANGQGVPTAAATATATVTVTATATATVVGTGTGEGGRQRRRPNVAASVILGLATALVPMAVGGSLLAFDDENVKHVGLYVMQAGFTLTPLVSHGVAGEWARGALFAIPGVVAEVGMAAVLAVKPDVATYGEPASRVPFASFLGLSIIGAGAGIIDSFLAGQRWDRLQLHLSPSASADRLGLSLTGSF